MSAQSPPIGPTTGLSSITARQWLILGMVQLTTLIFGMTITSANVVLPQIKGAMSATQDQIAWVVTFNLVATAIATPMVGWLSNRLGWRQMLVTSMCGFTLFSLLCGLAHNLESLVLYRVGQGLFGAPIMPMGQGILLATFPKAMHPLVMMMWGVGAVFGPISGPVLGAVISEAFNWRGAFLMVVPPGILAIGLVWFALAPFTEKRITKFDWTGFLALAIAIGAAQLIMDRGQRLDWFESTEIILEAIACAIGFWIFIAHCLTAREPIVDPRLLQDRNFAVGLFLVFVMGMLSYTPIVLFPGLLNDLKGYPEGLIGMLLAGRGIGNLLSFMIVVQVTNRCPRLGLAAGMLIQAASGWWMAQLDLNMSSGDVFWSNVMQGFGFGLAFTPMSVLAFATLPTHRMTEAMPLFHLMRNFGSSLFISASIVLLIRSTAENYANMTELISPFNKTLDLPGVAGRWSAQSTDGLVAISGEIQRQAAMIGYINAFYLFTIASVLAVPLACLMVKVPKE
ncbi:MAG: DHA2 family multidrug resistance protein [Hyphomicrobiaceae bacterium]|jgi:DHA2 family multidrug resistance protein